ncbi:Rha family transcriptional regulator [Paenibacillus daejeonensis]|uniref:Rha family transcriptional regulator n=1 Tax=Paenibacillus daejeonensis TaxID=135193 RepID=UPI00036368B6|nr:Rha family transcriptional regulator [Paenibacillus daejeonensis]
MQNLVFIQNGRPITDSLTIAETFGKDHDKVIRDIRTLDCSPEFSTANFGESTYRSDRGRTYPKYLITQDGFAFLVMGYTGREAARFKERYIAEFNRMRDALNVNPFVLPGTLPEALRLAADLAEKNSMLQGQIEAERPLVVFAESLQVSEDSILVADLSKLLRQNGINTGEKRLFDWLRQNGYLIKGGSEYNMPTQRSMDLGIMEVKIGLRSSASEGTKQTRTTKITGKGQIYFINKFLSQSAKLA